MLCSNIPAQHIADNLEAIDVGPDLQDAALSFIEEECDVQLRITEEEIEEGRWYDEITAKEFVENTKQRLDELEVARIDPEDARKQQLEKQLEQA